MERLTDDIVEAIETRHNVWVDADTRQYNITSKDAETGWQPIPQAWIEGA